MTERRRLLPLALIAMLAACGAGGDSDPNGARPAGGAGSATAAAAPAPAHSAALLRLVRVGTFSNPLYVTAPPGDSRRLFVVEQGGRIRIIRDGSRLAVPFLDISREVTAGGEQGLLSMAFAPDYATSGRFYVYFTDRAGNQRVYEYRRASLERGSGSRRLLLFMRDFEDNHNGGLLKFGPDRLLYIGTGDGGGANDRHGARGNAQNLGSLLGKILRIDPRPLAGRPYRIPPTNPFIRRPGARREIFAYGLRNPWRFSFDRRTGDMVIGDVGQSTAEEIDFATRATARGRNWGWRPFEGRVRKFNEPAVGASAPVFTYGHAGGACSITAGYVVRDPALRGHVGKLLYGDFCDGRLRSIFVRPGRAFGDAPAAPRVDDLSSFGEDALGRVYVVSLNGPVYRLSP